MTDRLDAQIRFLLDADRLKGIDRQNLVGGGARRENSAEHSWHLALMAAVLAEHAAEPVDLARVVLMLLVHDLVEIDAGDTFVYDESARLDKADRERAAAERIFGLLPDDQERRLRALWEEFEARQTPESRFAASIDRLQPLLLNSITGGVPWQQHGVSADRVLARNAHVAEGAPALWELARAVIDRAVADGILDRAPGSEPGGDAGPEDGARGGGPVR